MCGTLLTYLAPYKTTALLLSASSVCPLIEGIQSWQEQKARLWNLWSRGESRHRLYLFELSLGSPLPLLTVLAGVLV